MYKLRRRFTSARKVTTVTNIFAFGLRLGFVLLSMDLCNYVVIGHGQSFFFAFTFTLTWLWFRSTFRH